MKPPSMPTPSNSRRSLSSAVFHLMVRAGWGLGAPGSRAWDTPKAAPDPFSWTRA